MSVVTLAIGVTRANRTSSLLGRPGRWPGTGSDPARGSGTAPGAPAGTAAALAGASDASGRLTSALAGRIARVAIRSRAHTRSTANER